MNWEEILREEGLPGNPETHQVAADWHEDQGDYAKATYHRKLADLWQWVKDNDKKPYCWVDIYKWHYLPFLWGKPSTLPENLFLRLPIDYLGDTAEKCVKIRISMHYRSERDVWEALVIAWLRLKEDGEELDEDHP